MNESNPIKILVTGDLVINQSYQIQNISPELVSLFKGSDLNIVNLEAPITVSKSAIFKTGPSLKSDKASTLNILKYLNVDVVTLANNHVLDYDEKGVSDTLDFCKENNFKFVGAGSNLEEASKTLFLECKVGKIAIVNFAENEWSSATDDTAGANPMDLVDNTNQIIEAKKLADYVIVIIHGGHEYYNLPSPRMQKQYRFYAKQGADIVIGHHTHCISGNEIYNGVPIFYSLGNFLFTSENVNSDWYTGLILEISIENNILNTKLLPVKQNKKSFNLSLLEDDGKDRILERVKNYNLIIENYTQLKNEWLKFINSKEIIYLNRWSPLSFLKFRYIKSFFYKLKIRAINKSGLALYLNLMRCEAHADVSKEIIRNYLKK